MYKIKFGTDGWRDIVADKYTVENVSRVAQATATWINKHYNHKAIVLGYDCRFGGKMFAETVIKVMHFNNIKVYFNSNFCTTPVLSFACSRRDVALGVMITASHNPPSYNGYKLKSNFGGPTPETEIKDIEGIIKDEVPDTNISIENVTKSGNLEIQDFNQEYIDYIKTRFDLNKISNSGLKISYNAMYGAGQSIFPCILPDSHLFNCEWNPNFNHMSPEPIARYMQDYLEEIKTRGDIDFAFVTDGDADRIALVSSDGEYIDSHMVILMLIYICFKFKKLTGKVVIAFSVSPKIEKLCNILGLEVVVTKIGFKYIAEIIQKEQVKVDFIRSNNKMQTTISLTNKNNNANILKVNDYGNLNLGIKVSSLSVNEKRNYRLKGGVKIVNTSQGVITQNTHIKQGFVIVKVNNEVVNDGQGFYDIVQRYKDQTIVLEGFYPGKNFVYQYSFRL